VFDAFEYIISEIEQGRGGLEGITLLLFFSPLSSLLFPLFFLFSLSAPSDLQANSGNFATMTSYEIKKRDKAEIYHWSICPKKISWRTGAVQNEAFVCHCMWHLKIRDILLVNHELFFR
jgi:hypothetical protein